MSNEDRQIQAMIEFIERDAHEKAREYADEAQAMYDSEKANLVEAAKKKVSTQAEERKKQMEVERRVARAQISKQERMRVMDARSAILETLKGRVRDDVRKLTKDAAKYKALLGDLIRQSAVALAADSEIVCRKEDEAIVKGLIAPTQQAVEKAIGKSVKLTLSKDSLNDEEDWGGVTLRSVGGRPVLCNNTLAARMGHCFNEQLPTVRYYLFNEQAHN